MSIFQIAPLNPIRFIDVNTSTYWPSKYQTKPFDLETYQESIFDFQTDRCFYQKYQMIDETTIQIWSDFVPTCKVYNVDTGLNYTIPVINKGITFPDETFSIYEADFDFSDYGEGRLRIQITYTNVTEFTYLSEPIWVKETWENTRLFEYKNDENNFSIIFDTGIVFKMRIESILDNFTPKAERILYNDQIRNNTLLYGVSYREFRLNIGGREGISDWLIDKINMIFACNEVSIDGENYTIAQGAEWEPNRGEDYPLAGWRININPVDNRFNQRLKPGINDAGEEIQMILHSNNRTNVGGDQNYAGIFTKYAVLNGLGILKTSVPSITLLIGTTPGGSEISGPSGFIIDQDKQFLLINWVFDTTATVYLSGLSGANIDINLYYYLPYDITTGGGTVPTTGNFVKGTVYMYEEVTTGDFALHWDESTGLGRLGTKYEGCALMDGRNGCGNMIGRKPMMYGSYTDASGTYSYLKGQAIGIAKWILTRAQLPNFQLKYKGIPPGDNRFSSTGGGSQWNAPQNDLLTEALGSGEAHENRDPGYVLVFFKRIVD